MTALLHELEAEDMFQAEEKVSHKHIEKLIQSGKKFSRNFFNDFMDDIYSKNPYFEPSYEPFQNNLPLVSFNNRKEQISMDIEKNEFRDQRRLISFSDTRKEKLFDQDIATQIALFNISELDSMVSYKFRLEIPKEPNGFYDKQIDLLKKIPGSKFNDNNELFEIPKNQAKHFRI